MTPPSTPISELLANLSIPWILGIVLVLTVLRLGLIRIPTAGARSTAEIMESGIIAIVLVFLLIRPFVVQAFYIPSASMEPTLRGDDEVKDRILVSKFSYRLGEPHDGDVVVFLAPPAAMEGNPDFIKRLIGSPGDVIEVTAGTIVLNGRTYRHREVRDRFAEAGLFGPDAQAAAQTGNGSQEITAIHHVKFAANGVLADGRLVPAAQVAEVLAQQRSLPVQIHPGFVTRNGQRLEENYTAEDPDYDLKIVGGQPLKRDAEQGCKGAVDGTEQPISDLAYQQMAARPAEPIPAGMYLMMGDNRNDSKDSTEWGLLPRWRIVGQAKAVFWPITRIRAIQTYTH